MSDKGGLSDAIRKFHHAGRVICVHWLDGPKKSNSGVGICAGSLDSGLGESEFVGSKSLSGGAAHNFGILIHNLWDEMVRNLWDSSIIYGTAPQSTTIRSVFGERAGNHEAPQLGVDPPSRHPGPRPQDSA